MTDTAKLMEVKRELARIGVLVCDDMVCRLRMHDGREIHIYFDPDSPVAYIESWCAVKRGGFGTAYARIDEVPSAVVELDNICRSFEALVMNTDIVEALKTLSREKPGEREVEVDSGIQLVAVYTRAVVLSSRPAEKPSDLVRLILEKYGSRVKGDEK